MSGLRRFVKPPAGRVHLVQTGIQGIYPTSQPAMTAVPTAINPPYRDLARQTFGAVDQFYARGGGYGGQTGGAHPAGQKGPGDLPFQYVWQDWIQVPPAHEQPRLLFNSGAQPLIRWGLNRRYVRTFMSASPRFQGRWAFVGYIQRHFAERARMTGVPNRYARTYSYRIPSAAPGPRAIPLGGGQ